MDRVAWFVLCWGSGERFSLSNVRCRLEVFPFAMEIDLGYLGNNEDLFCSIIDWHNILKICSLIFTRDLVFAICPPILHVFSQRLPTSHGAF